MAKKKAKIDPTPVRVKDLERIRMQTQQGLEFNLGDWVSQHNNAVRPAIKALDRKTVESMALAHTIAVTN